MTTDMGAYRRDLESGRLHSFDGCKAVYAGGKMIIAWRDPVWEEFVDLSLRMNGINKYLRKEILP